jgi:hypothetical protein
MRLNPFIYGILVLAVFLGTIGIFQAAGAWSVSGKLTASGEKVAPNPADPASIKGWMTLEQLTTAYNFTIADLKARFNLTADITPATAVKDLESDTFETDDLRTWLKERISGAPSARGETAPAATQSTPAAPAILTTPVPTQAAAAGQTTPTVDPTVHTQTDFTITGKTTFQNLVDWGVKKEIIVQVVGSDPPLSAIIKDYATGKSLEFGTLKTALQAEVDKVKK